MVILNFGTSRNEQMRLLFKLLSWLETFHLRSQFNEIPEQRVHKTNQRSTGTVLSVTSPAAPLDCEVQVV